MPLRAKNSCTELLASVRLNTQHGNLSMETKEETKHKQKLPKGIPIWIRRR